MRNGTKPNLGEAKKLVAVVVPYYKNNLTREEEISLVHLRRFLDPYDKYLVVPNSLTPALTDFATKRFADTYFHSVFDYNKLVLSTHFYNSFRDYKYILIYQLDALVFSDQLMQWCALDLDYVGAPWLKNRAVPEEGCLNVGNGGFSLRKVETLLKVLKSPGTAIDPAEYWRDFCAQHSAFKQFINLPRKYLKGLSMFNNVDWYCRHPHDFEDIFWANIAPRVYPEFKIATIKQALRFSFEMAPEYCFAENNYELPF